jgi:hypothetical protein
MMYFTLTQIHKKGEYPIVGIGKDTITKYLGHTGKISKKQPTRREGDSIFTIKHAGGGAQPPIYI